jgi:catechol 2,3-dioxygenase-like lactoylglutathione lyase family enzyme
MAVPEQRLRTAAAVRGIDHVTVTTRDCRGAKRFYEVSLRPLGFAVSFDWPARGRAYLGLPGESSSIWIVQRSHPGRLAMTLSAADPSAVDAFYAAAVAAGGETVAEPAFRPELTARTYSASVLDPDGNTVEAISWHSDPPEAAAEAA